MVHTGHGNCIFSYLVIHTFVLGPEKRTRICSLPVAAITREWILLAADKRSLFGKVTTICPG